MATFLAPVPQVVSHRAENEARGWTSWITTTDHKRIGIMYMVTTFVFFCLGGVEALIMRLQLGAPNNTLVTPQTYNQLFTMHGTTMIRKPAGRAMCRCPVRSTHRAAARTPGST